MIQRPKYLSALKEYRDIPLVKNSCGIRRCGKSTILEMLKNDLISDGVRKKELSVCDTLPKNSMRE